MCKADKRCRCRSKREELRDHDRGNDEGDLGLRGRERGRSGWKLLEAVDRLT